jgi:2-methylisocitrate lyase-like PEP mutase family enzyme
MLPNQPDLARQFHALHHDGLLLLANAWDAGSARLIESLGAKAIATTSAGVAWSHGYADGNQLPVKLLAATVSEIVRVIRVPLSVDCEGGYSDDPATVAENIGAVIEAGAIGINLEDGNRDLDLFCRKLEYVRRAAERRAVDLFINARTDLYIRPGVAPEKRVDEVIARAERYRAAGASGIFAIGVVELNEIRTIASGAKLPLNVLARPTLPPAAELAKLGVRRLSAGGGLLEVAYARIGALATQFLRDGVSAPLYEGAMTYRDINALMVAR